MAPRFDGFVPGRHLIDSFGAGGFRFAEMSHRGSVLCTPAGVHQWPAVIPADIDADSLAPVLAEAESIDFLLIGAGRDPFMIPPALRERLREARITVEAMATAAAARTYNVLVAENRRVAAALLAVE